MWETEPFPLAASLCLDRTGFVMSSLSRAVQIRREAELALRIPYSAQVAEGIVKSVFGDYVQIFRLAGASFESADDVELNTWHERLNVLWRNVASPQIALWAHLVRRREQVAPGSGNGAGFAQRLAEHYRQRLSGETLMVNELYVTTVYRPVPLRAASQVSRLLSRAQRDASHLELRDALDACDKLRQTVCASLERYEPEPLGVYRSAGRLYSRPLEFLSLLLSAEYLPVPLPSAPLSNALGGARVLFGNEAIEYRGATETRLGAILGIKEYASPSVVGMYDALLSAAFPFVLTQSFTFLTKAAGQGLLQRQFNRMLNAGDFAVSQAQELKEALDALTANQFVMGDHHFSLQVLTDASDRGSTEASARLIESLNDRVAIARSLLADTGMTVAREDLALEAAFWAQLPGNFPMRPRKAAITSRNFCAMVPFHNHPSGRATGNHWGDALALLVTSARSPYYFSLHASDPTAPDGGSRKDTGHTFICGPTGSGKTVLIGFLITMLSRQGATQVILDKDRGLEILVRALGGEYLPLRNGIPTGFNPLQLPTSANNEEFLKLWLSSLARPVGGRALTVREQADLDQALRGTLALEQPERRLSRLVEFLDPTDPEGVHARLARWCEATRGDYGWAFDNAEDSVVSRLGGRPIVGFDVTEFLDNDTVRAPVTLYLFHLVRRLLDGRRLVCWMDEFWRLLADPAFERFAKDGPKTWRKLNGVMCVATQSASDVLESAISRTIIEQTPTKILFPNVDASEEEYVGGFGLTEREFKLVKEQLEPGSRAFLVKQGHHSVVCQLDLKGFEAELAVISGRAVEVERMHRIIARVGSDPSQWLPSFLGRNEGELPCH
ncbi:MAG TPA: VirB4 family type IV secretion/conjugal transfer ATPase [Steroidobacteraceae bacterium]|nr:VirB4 family type IV secretion/conjugal transfer ATPase [Steroidobacteraceae bacterium]